MGASISSNATNVIIDTVAGRSIKASMSMAPVNTPALVQAGVILLILCACGTLLYWWYRDALVNAHDPSEEEIVKREKIQRDKGVVTFVLVALFLIALVLLAMLALDRSHAFLWGFAMAGSTMISS